MLSLECQTKKAFKAPPKEWIEHRLDNLHETLQKNTTSSALALKKYLEQSTWRGFPGEQHIENNNLIQEKPYYIAHSNIQTLALLDDKTKGSNWLQMRREWDSNPRYVFTYTRFPSVLLRPLRHPSKRKERLV